MDSTDFYFNGGKSVDKSVYLVNINSGMQTTPFLSEKEVISDQIVGNDIPYVYGTKRSPLVVELTLSTLDKKWTYEKRREIARWLDTDTFEEFYSVDDVHKKYYLQYVGGIDLTHNTTQQGYITVRMLNISPFSYSPVYTKSYDLADISSPTVIEFKCDSDNILKPELWIEKIGVGDLSIVNLSDGGMEFKFTGLHDLEQIYVDNKHRHIETDVVGLYRYDSFNDGYLELPRGLNRLEVTGRCKLTFRYQFETKG